MTLTVVDQSKTRYLKPVINSTFYEFSKDMGFEVKSCMAYRPQTKGKVESLARIMNRLRVYNDEFEDYDELAEIVRTLNEDINNEVSQAILEKRAAQIIITTSHFPYLKTIHDFDFDYQPSVKKVEIQDLLTLRFLEGKNN